jgi:hypothetical protein
VALALLLAGCSHPGQVKNFNDQTQSNFNEACKAANDNSMSEEDVADLCRCWYDAVVNEDTGMSFDRFKEEDENIREAIDAGRFNNDADFDREAPTLKRIVDENCQPETGPQAG